MDFPRPQMVLDIDALTSNIDIMARWALDRGLLLAPHIKTTMTRAIVERQLDAGAWAVTVATPRQAATAHSWGLKRILLINEIVDISGLCTMRTLLEQDPDLELYCLADSDAGVERLGNVFASLPGRLRVLVDVGRVGGRTGVRTLAQARNLGARIRDKAPLILAGVSAYEGVAPVVERPAALAGVDHHLVLAADTFDELFDLMEADPVFTAGGSAFPDRAAVHRPVKPHTPVLRSGCYVTHDHGLYATVSPIEGLRAAATVHTVVTSVPEPGLAVLNAGKRELAYDAGLPVIVRIIGPDGDKQVNGMVEKLYDHHCVLTNANGLAVGDTVVLGISHPCSLFDRWSLIEAVSGDMTEAWRTEF